MKSGYTTVIPSVKNQWVKPGEAVASTPKRNIQAHAVHLVGSAGGSVLRAAPTQPNHHRRSLSTTIDAFEPSIERETAAI